LTTTIAMPRVCVLTDKIPVSVRTHILVI
jgi:hypothetical protein